MPYHITNTRPVLGSREEMGVGNSMNKFHVFVVRAILGAVFAVILSRFFYPSINIAFVMGLGIVLVGLAYVSEYFHQRNIGKKNRGQ